MMFSIKDCIKPAFVFIIILFFYSSFNVILAAPSIDPSTISTNAPSYPNGLVPKYEKFEITFDITNSQALNFQFPYVSSADANQYLQKYINLGISVDGIFLPPGETNWNNAYRTPAFYYEEFLDEIRNNKVWNYPTGNFKWKVRFSPNQQGIWKYKLTAQDKGGSVESGEFSFTVATSNNKGFIKVSPNDSRYFEFDDGTYFPATGYNLGMGQLDNDTVLQELKDNKIQFVRSWFAPFNINSTAWTAWEMMPGHYGGYLPRVPMVPYEEVPGSGQPRQMKWIVSEDSTWFEPCTFIGHTQPSPAVKPNTTYYIRAKYKTENVTGPRDGLYPDYGFVIKIGGWDDDCQNPNKPNEPSFALNYPFTNYGTDTNWNYVQGEWNSGSNNFLPNFYMVLENASTGKAYIESIEVREKTGGTVDNPVLTGANIIDKYSPDELSYFAQKPSYKMDRIVEKLKQYDVYVRPVILEKGEEIGRFTDVNGDIIPVGVTATEDNFYGGTQRCTNCREYTAQRWLQDAWFRYVQARWGYSTNIHSWELLNEGDPDHWGHFAQTDEIGKTFKCRVFGKTVGYNDTEPCTFDHPNAHMVSTSFWHSFPAGPFWKNTKYPNVDYADVHAYISTSAGINYSLPECSKLEMAVDAAAYHECHSRQYGGSNIGKPLVRGEAGMDIASSQSHTVLNIQQDTEGIWLHNYLWAGLSYGGLIEQYWWVGEHIDYSTTTYVSGSAGSPPPLPYPTCDAPVFEQNNSRWRFTCYFDNRDEYAKYFNFIKDISLNKGNYVDTAATVGNSNLRAWGQKDIANGNAHVWIQNRHHRWAQMLRLANKGIISFGQVPPEANTTSFTFTNPEASTTTPSITVTRVFLNQGAASEFSVTSHDCTTLTTGGTCTINLRYTPSAKSFNDPVTIEYTYKNSNNVDVTKTEKRMVVGMQPTYDESGDVTISGFSPSLTSVTLEKWDTYTGTVTSTQTNYPVTNGSVTIPVTNLTTDVAYKIINPSAPSPTPTPPPDPNNLNGQGGVDLADIILLIQYIFNPSGTIIAQGADPDINNDGTVNLLDIIALIGIIFS